MTGKQKKQQSIRMPNGKVVQLGTIHDSGEYVTTLLNHGVTVQDEPEAEVVTDEPEAATVSLRLLLWACVAAIMNLVATVVFISIGHTIWIALPGIATGITLSILAIIVKNNNNISRRKK